MPQPEVEKYISTTSGNFREHAFDPTAVISAVANVNEMKSAVMLLIFAAIMRQRSAHNGDANANRRFKVYNIHAYPHLFGQIIVMNE